jgi:hypothetical protein
VDEIAAFLRASAVFPDTAAGPPPVAVRDPDDAVILSEALVLRADVLVTGDKDLLEAGEVPGISILDPRSFWQLVRGEASTTSIVQGRDRPYDQPVDPPDDLGPRQAPSSTRAREVKRFRHSERSLPGCVEPGDEARHA